MITGIPTASSIGSGSRRRVLIGAYACGPSDTPEASAGWAFATAAAAHHDVWVITRTIWLPAIERALAADPALAEHLNVVGIDLSPRLVKRKRRAVDLYWYYVLWQRKLGRIALELHRSVGFDVAHHASFANDWLPSGVTALEGVPIVWGPVGGATRIPVWRLRRWLGVRGVAYEAVRAAATTLPRRIWGDRNARRASIVVVQNGDVAHRFRRARRVVVESNAALDMTALPPRGKPEPAGASRTAVFVGRLIPLKGVAIALAALARPGAADWKLTIYGDGPLRANLEAEAASLGIAERVRFAGHVPRTEVLEAMATADALLFPSMHDQAGWAVAEASSMGTPVVCLPLGGPPVLAAPNDLIAGLEGDVVDNVVEQLERAVTFSGVPHERWSRGRLTATVDGWYRDALDEARRTAHASDRPLRALESVSAIRPTTNPYLAQLVAGLREQPGVSIQLFDYRRAILGGYDVIHVHWPEVLFGGNRRTGRLARRTLATILLARVMITRTPVVRTWHNLDRPEDVSRWERILLDGFDRCTSAVIRLNGTTDVPLSVPVHTIPHGHYRDWFEGVEQQPAVPGRVVYLGLIRRYKGVEHLIEAFRDSKTPGATLTIAGRPSSDELATSLTELASGDGRVSLALRFLDDSDFARTISTASLVVLPYRHMHNSGTMLAALSLDRPVLVPANETNRALADEIGAGWVHLYEGELTGAAIDGALADLEAAQPQLRPRLGGRDWALGAAAHVAAFRATVNGRAIIAGQHVGQRSAPAPQLSPAQKVPATATVPAPVLSAVP